MKKPLSDYFLPHKDNDDKPHIVRSSSLLTLFFVVIIVFAASVFEASRIQSDSHFVAAVLPSVLVSLTNDDRVEYGLGQLENSPLLEEAAQLKANDMVNRGYFDHVSPDGVTPWAWFDRVGYSYAHAGENLAINFSESVDVVKAWMNSEGHRTNILDSNFTQTGIATAVGTYKGKEAVFVVQLFGAPRPSATTPIASVYTENFEEEEVYEAIQNEEEIEVPSVGVVAGSEAPNQEEVDTTPDVNAVEEPVTVEEEVVSAGETEPSSVSEQEQNIPVQDEPETLSQDEFKNQTKFDRWFSLHPVFILQLVYAVIGGFILFSLGLMVYRAAHQRHLRSMVAGVLLIILMIILAYITYRYTFPIIDFFATFKG